MAESFLASIKGLLVPFHEIPGIRFVTYLSWVEYTDGLDLIGFDRIALSGHRLKEGLLALCSDWPLPCPCCFKAYYRLTKVTAHSERPSTINMWPVS